MNVTVKAANSSSQRALQCDSLGYDDRYISASGRDGVQNTTLSNKGASIQEPTCIPTIHAQLHHSWTQHQKNIC